MGIEALIKGSERLTRVFGYWPSFHDAEIIWVRLVRGERPEEGFAGPSIEMSIHTFEITNEVAPTGFLILKNHVLVHFQFTKVVNVKLEDFNHQNVLFNLRIADIRQDQLESINFAISLDSSFGLSGRFRCKAAEILAVTPCDANGNA